MDLTLTATTDDLEVGRDDESSLIEAARNSSDAFARLYRRHYRTAASYIFRRTGDADATEDLTSEVFLTVMRNLARYEQRGIPFKFWLYRIASNTVNRWIRDRKRDRAGDPVIAERATSRELQCAERLETAEKLRQLLQTLAPGHQTVFALHYFEDLTIEQIALVVGCRPGTVKSRLSRTRERLRQRFESEDGQ